MSEHLLTCNKTSEFENCECVEEQLADAVKERDFYKLRCEKMAKAVEHYYYGQYLEPLGVRDRKLLDTLKAYRRAQEERK